MAASAWSYYDQFLVDKNDGTTDLDAAATFYIALFLSTSNAETATLTALPTNQHANGNGYTTGGIVMTPALTGSSQSVKWDFTNDAVWTASGGSILARYAVIYSGTQPIAWSLLDNTPDDVEATDGNTLTVSISANGIFNEAPA